VRLLVSLGGHVHGLVRPFLLELPIDVFVENAGNQGLIRHSFRQRPFLQSIQVSRRQANVDALVCFERRRRLLSVPL
jgi:hypothetical protein